MRSRPARSIPAAKAPAAARIPAATPVITAKHPLDHTVVIDRLESNSEVSYLDVLIAGWAPRGDGGANFRTRGRGVRQAPVLACRPCHRGHRCSSVVGRCCARGGGPPQLPQRFDSRVQLRHRFILPGSHESRVLPAIRSEASQTKSQNNCSNARVRALHATRVVRATNHQVTTRDIHRHVTQNGHAGTGCAPRIRSSRSNAVTSSCGGGSGGGQYQSAGSGDRSGFASTICKTRRYAALSSR